LSGDYSSAELINRLRSMEDRARVVRQELEHLERNKVIKKWLSERARVH
jgi:hypothetical protein